MATTILRSLLRQSSTAGLAVAVAAALLRCEASSSSSCQGESKGKKQAAPALRLTVDKASMTEVDVTKKFKHPHHFIYKALLDAKSDKIQRYAIFTSLPTKEIEIEFRVGKGVQSHRGIAHGGCVASILDDGFGCLFYSCCGGVPGFTAHLDVDYRQPVPIDTDLIFRSRVVSEEGRKVWLEGQILMPASDGSGSEKVLTEGRALFIKVRADRAGDASAPSAGAIVHQRQ